MIRGEFHIRGLLPLGLDSPIAKEFLGKRRFSRKDSACLVNQRFADQIEEGLVDARIVGKFRVESRGHSSSLPNGDGSFIAALGGDDFDAFADVLDFRSADENHFQGRIAEQTLADGAIDLASVGVAADADVKGAEAFLLRILDLGGQENCAGTGAEGGLGVDELFQLFESGVAQELQEGARFAARDHEAINDVEFLGFLDQHNFGTQLLEPAAVSVEIALQGQDTDFHTKTSTTEGTADTGDLPCEMYSNG